MAHKCVIYVSTFSAYYSLKTIGATKFIYVKQLIYTTLQTKFESNIPRILLVTVHVPEILWILFVFFFFAQNTLAEKGECKQSSCEWILTKFGTPLAPSLA